MVLVRVCTCMWSRLVGFGIPGKWCLWNKYYKDFNLISLSQKAEKIVEKYDERQRTTEEVLNDLIDLIDQSFKDNENQKKSGLDIETFFYYKFLEEENIKDAKTKSKKLKELFEKNKSWKENQNSERELRQEIYLILDNELNNIENLKLIVEKWAAIPRDN